MPLCKAARCVSAKWRSFTRDGVKVTNLAMSSNGVNVTVK